MPLSGLKLHTFGYSLTQESIIKKIKKTPKKTTQQIKTRQHLQDVD